MPIKSQYLSYKSVLDLEKDPFSPEPDPQFYYAFNSFEQRLALLKRLVQGTDILVLVIGEPGSGKTTLLKRYLSSSDKIWEPGKIRTYPAAAKPPDPYTPGGLTAYVQLDSKEPIVIVDDAHTLTREELMFLLREAIVPGSSQMIKRLILLGESKLFTAIKTFADSIIGETTINKIYMPGLTGEEAAAYLQHRLRVSGYKGDSLFSSSVVKKIHKMSGGFPGPMNENADQWLKENYSGGERHQSAFRRLSTRPRRILTWASAGFAVLLLAAMLYYVHNKTTVSKTEAGKTAGKVFRAKIPENPESTGKVFRAKIPAGQHSIKPIAKTKAAPPVEQKAVSSQPITSPPEKKEPAAETTPPRAEVQPLPKTIEPAEKPVTAKEEIQPPPQELEKAEKIVLPQEQVQPLPETIEPAEKPVTAKEGIQPPPKELEKAEKRRVRREDWLLSQNSRHYTIQIMGVSNEITLPDFIRKNRLLEQNEIAYYQTTFRGKPWFQLLYGIYAGKEEARLAAEKLPENIRKLTPWIRRISAVQKSIRGAQ